MKELLLSELKFNAYTLQVNLEGVDDAQSEVQPKTDVNSVKWILGHLVNTRIVLLKNIGLKPVKSENIEEMDIDGLYSLFTEIQNILEGFLNENSDIEEEKVMVITKYMLHESYHIGQIGYCRRFLGLAGALY